MKKSKNKEVANSASNMPKTLDQCENQIDRVKK